MGLRFHIGVLLVSGVLATACRGATPAPPPTSAPVVPEQPGHTAAAATLAPTPTSPPTVPLLRGQTAATAALAPTPAPPVDAAPPANETVAAAPAPTPGPMEPLEVEPAFPGLTFRGLTNLAQPDDGTGRLFVTEQGGRVILFAGQQETSVQEVFLDISGHVNRGNNEEGLLGLAFDPRFRETGHFYVYYSAADPRRSVLSRFAVSRDDPKAADAGSELIILEIPQPYGNHNGGQLAFGPDGYLYIGLGDGGGGGDPHGNGQDPRTLLGSILRIDVAGASENERYRIPPDNPFVDAADARPEVWAYGLRNPWRFSFDAQTGHLWAGDVGQNNWEEIDLVRKGGNYGWNVMEGSHCYSPRSNCDTAGLELPVAEYPTDGGCSVIGGYVYRGSRLPSLAGAYVYSDFCSGQIWGLRYDGRSVVERLLLAESGLQVTSFGQDLAGNLYVLSRDSGVYRLASRQ